MYLQEIKLIFTSCSILNAHNKTVKTNATDMKAVQEDTIDFAPVDDMKGSCWAIKMSFVTNPNRGLHRGKTSSKNYLYPLVDLLFSGDKNNYD